ncbi:MAG: type IV pilin protein [Vogesella sp.]|uniref:type IV pilin protein n=1 Tax=Vogesella sp. TaxID=1904252 RepID=UPI00391A9569
MRLIQRGFTLIELIIGMLLLSLLLSVAGWQYDSYLKRMDQQAVASLLQQNASFLERFYSERGSYKATPSQWPVLPHQRYPASGTARYQLAFGSTPRNTDPDYYVLRATASDEALGYIELLQTGTLRRCFATAGTVQCSPL